MPIDAAHTCPRCAYDLRGAIDAWKTECPLEGKCPECGLDYAWRDILSPTHAIPPWSFEHARSRLPLRLFQTTLHALWPWGIMRDIRMGHSIVPKRLFVMAISAMLWAHFAISFMTASYTAEYACFYDHGGTRLTRADYERVLVHALWPYPSAWHIHIQNQGVMLLVAALLFLYSLLVPLAFFALHRIFARRRVRIWHVVRAWVYSMIPISAAMSAIFLVAGFLSAIATLFPTLQAGRPWDGYWRGANGFPLVRGYFGRVLELAPLVMPLLVPWIWWAVGKRYLRISHPFIVACILSFIALLTTVLILFFNPWSSIWSD